MAESDPGLHSKAWSAFMDLPSAGLGVPHSAMLHHSPHSSIRAPVLPGYPSTGVTPVHGHLADMTAAAAAYGVASSTAAQVPFSTSAAGVGYPYSMTSRGGCGVYGLPSPPRSGAVTSCGSGGGQQLSFDSYYHMSTAGASLHLASAAAAAVRSGVR